MVQQIDARGPRFAAMLTTLVLAAVLLASPGDAATALLAVQAAVLGAGALAGVQHTPYSWIFRKLVRPRISAPTELEDPGPPRFAQAVGLGFTLVALLGYLSGATLVGAVVLARLVGDELSAWAWPASTEPWASRPTPQSAGRSTTALSPAT